MGIRLKKRAGIKQEIAVRRVSGFDEQKRLLFHDALTAHAVIVFTKYLMIAMKQRRCDDDCTMAEIFS